MQTTIDAAGRIVIPKEIRRQAGLRPGTTVNVEVYDGRVEIEPACLDVRFEQRGRFLVAVSDTPVETVTDADVEAVRDAIVIGRAT